MTLLLIQIKNGHTGTDIVNYMVPMKENFGSAPQARMPVRAFRFGRAALLVGLALFALNALSPCIDAIAAPVGNDAPDGTAALAITPTGVPNGHPDEGSESSCHHLAGAVPSNSNALLALTANDSPPGWVAIEGVTTASLPAGPTASGNLARRETPPTPRRLYLRTLRLLI